MNLRFFPPNMTAEAQPMDQGVIKNFKHHYHRLIVEQILDDIEGGVQSNIDVLQANQMIFKT